SIGERLGAAGLTYIILLRFRSHHVNCRALLPRLGGSPLRLEASRLVPSRIDCPVSRTVHTLGGACVLREEAFRLAVPCVRGPWHGALLPCIRLQSPLEIRNSPCTGHRHDAREAENRAVSPRAIMDHRIAAKTL